MSDQLPSDDRSATVGLLRLLMWQSTVIDELAVEVGAFRAIAEATTPYAARVARLEHGLIRRSLADHGGRVTDVAEALQIKRETLYGKIARLEPQYGAFDRRRIGLATSS